MSPTFFETPAAFRKWLAKHHATEKELLVGFHKVGSGKPSITWPESVDEALCFGWIDGVRRRIDDVSYSIRFSPRKTKSIWSAVNLKRAKALIADGRMQPAGMAAFEKRDEKLTKRYSFEQHNPQLDPPLLKTFKANTKAWAYFEAQPPGYRRIATWFVMSAKRDETRVKRLQRLIDCSARGERLT